MVTSWNTGLAAERARHNLKLKKKVTLKHTNLKEKYASLEPEAPSSKRQASSALKKT
jgi:hypothetical protein